MKQVQATQNNDRCNAVYLQIYQHKQTHILLSYVVTLRSSFHTNTRNSRCHYPKYSFLTQPCTGVRSGDGGRVPRSTEGTSPRFDSSICSTALESSQMMTGWSAEVTSESESAARSTMSSTGLVLEHRAPAGVCVWENGQHSVSASQHLALRLTVHQADPQCLLRQWEIDEGVINQRVADFLRGRPAAALVHGPFHGYAFS